MSRKTKSFEISGYDKTFVVKELRIKEILNLTNQDGLDDLSLTNLKQKFTEVFLPICSNITFEDLADMTPTEAKEVWEKFREVNDSFFELARLAGLDRILNEVLQAFARDFGKLAVISSNQDMLES